MEDLSEHHSQWVEPVSVNYRGYDVWELPPNGQGIAALQLLNILENKDFNEVHWGSEEHLHLFTEAKKRVFEDRAKYYADMDMAQVPVEALLSKEYAAENYGELKPYASNYDLASSERLAACLGTTMMPNVSKSRRWTALTSGQRRWSRDTRLSRLMGCRPGTLSSR